MTENIATTEANTERPGFDFCYHLRGPVLPRLCAHEATENRPAYAVVNLEGLSLFINSAQQAQALAEDFALLSAFMSAAEDSREFAHTAAEKINRGHGHD